MLQKSLKEGFGLTVSEALWKGKPVIAGAVGGIPLQIAHRYSGILTHTVEGTAFWIKQLLNSPDYATRLGENGREHVRTNFLLTRHLREYLLLFLFLEHQRERVIHLQLIVQRCPLSVERYPLGRRTQNAERTTASDTLAAGGSRAHAVAAPPPAAAASHSSSACTASTFGSRRSARVSDSALPTRKVLPRPARTRKASSSASSSPSR